MPLVYQQVFANIRRLNTKSTALHDIYYVGNSFNLQYLTTAIFTGAVQVQLSMLSVAACFSGFVCLPSHRNTCFRWTSVNRGLICGSVDSSQSLRLHWLWQQALEIKCLFYRLKKWTGSYFVQSIENLPKLPISICVKILCQASVVVVANVTYNRQLKILTK